MSIENNALGNHQILELQTLWLKSKHFWTVNVGWVYKWLRRHLDVQNWSQPGNAPCHTSCKVTQFVAKHNIAPLPKPWFSSNRYRRTFSCFFFKIQIKKTYFCQSGEHAELGNACTKEHFGWSLLGAHK